MQELVALLEKRISLIQELQTKRNSILISYISDGSMDIFDGVRVYTVLKEMCKVTGSRIKQLDLLLFSSGGDIDAAYKIVCVLRQYCESLNIIVPFYAKSAATLLCLGANKLVMGPPSELGPIDPQVRLRTLKFGGPAQAIRDCIDYIYDKLKTADDKDVMRNVMYPIIDKLDPWLIGNFERSVKVSKQYANQLLQNYMLKGYSDDYIISVANKLTEEFYSHGYVIGKEEARKVGLVVDDITGEVWEIIWDLFLTYFEQINKTEGEITLIESEDTIANDITAIKAKYIDKSDINESDTMPDEI